MSILPMLNKYIISATLKYEAIADERKSLLEEFAEYISSKITTGEKVKLNFICTHNSRRSHLSQIWAQTAAYYYGIPNVECYSGGTEATAFNERAVKSIEDAGFLIARNGEPNNHTYYVHYSEDSKPIQCFSKKYDDSFNPQKDFAAIMTCSDADEKCPVILGADKRFPIRYEDPKAFDGTEWEVEKYAARCKQIATEMLYVFSKVKMDY
jgi:arsenate reductase